MLALTRKTGYALIALSLLARSTRNVGSARTVAEDSGVPLPILMNILKTLHHAGVVASERGPNGGYRLAKSVEAISVNEVVTAIEGPIQFVRCRATNGEPSSNRCDLQERCPVRLPAHRIHERLEQFLESVSLAELIDMKPEPADSQPTRLQSAAQDE